MFRNTYQAGFVSILYSIGSKPLQLWQKEVRNGHIKRITDGDIHSSVLEICGSNVSTTYITCPAEPKKTLGIKLPILVLVVKNLKKYFTFEVTLLDDKNVHRRFRASNYQSTTRVKPFICTMPLRLDDGWNQIQFNLADFTSKAYGTNYVETLRVQIHANCRIRRVYFEDKLYAEEELPADYRLFVPKAPHGASAAGGHGATAASAAVGSAPHAIEEGAEVVPEVEAEEIIAVEGSPVVDSDGSAPPPEDAPAGGEEGEAPADAGGAESPAPVEGGEAPVESGAGDASPEAPAAVEGEGEATA